MIVISHHGLRCFLQLADLEVSLVRCPAAKRLMRPNAVVDAGVTCQHGSCIGRCVTGSDVDIFVLGVPQRM